MQRRSREMGAGPNQSYASPWCGLGDAHYRRIGRLVGAGASTSPLLFTHPLDTGSQGASQERGVAQAAPREEGVGTEVVMVARVARVAMAAERTDCVVVG